MRTYLLWALAIVVVSLELTGKASTQLYSILLHALGAGTLVYALGAVPSKRSSRELIKDTYAVASLAYVFLVGGLNAHTALHETVWRMFGGESYLTTALIIGTCLSLAIAVISLGAAVVLAIGDAIEWLATKSIESFYEESTVTTEEDFVNYCRPINA